MLYMLGETVSVAKPEFFRQGSTTTIKTVLVTKFFYSYKNLLFLLKLEEYIAYSVLSQE